MNHKATWIKYFEIKYIFLDQKINTKNIHYLETVGYNIL